MFERALINFTFNFESIQTLLVCRDYYNVPKGKKTKTNVVTHYKCSLKSDVIAPFVMTCIKCTGITTIAMTCINVIWLQQFLSVRFIHKFVLKKKIGSILFL